MLQCIYICSYIWSCVKAICRCARWHNTHVKASNMDVRSGCQTCQWRCEKEAGNDLMGREKSLRKKHKEGKRRRWVIGSVWHIKGWGIFHHYPLKWCMDTHKHTHVVYCTVTMLSEAEESTSYGDSERTRGREEWGSRHTVIWWCS